MREAAQEPNEENLLVCQFSALPDAMVGPMRSNNTMTVVKLKRHLQILELQHHKNFLEWHAMLVNGATYAQAAVMWLKNGKWGTSFSSSTPICSNCNTPGHTFVLCRKIGGGSGGKPFTNRNTSELDWKENVLCYKCDNFGHYA